MRSFRGAVIVLMLSGIAPGLSEVAGQTPKSAVTVTLKAKAQAGSVVRIRDVAVIEGGETLSRDLIGGLDLAEFAVGQEILSVNRDQVGFRLIVAGLDPRSFRLVGEPRCKVLKETRDSAFVVKSRDRVKLVARLGGGQVTATGEAMEDGYAGQSIRVRNLDSNRTVLGRVVAIGVVEVEY